MSIGFAEVAFSQISCVQLFADDYHHQSSIPQQTKVSTGLFQRIFNGLRNSRTTSPPPTWLTQISSYSATMEDLKAYHNQNPRRFDLLNKMRKQFDRENRAPFLEEEAVALFEYKGPGYRDVNSAMRKIDIEQLNRLQYQIKLIASGLNRLPNYPGEVFRMDSLPEGELARMRTLLSSGEPLQVMSFLSTTKFEARWDVAGDLENVNVRYRILSKYGKDISEFVNPTEGEVVFLPGRFRLLQMEEDANGMSSVTMEQID